MSDHKQILHKQAQWQKSRQFLTWEEKVRLAEQVRDSVRQWREQSAGSKNCLSNATRAAITSEITNPD